MSLQEAQAAAPLMGRRGVSEHRKYVEAIEARDVEAAQQVMRKHLQRTEARVREIS
jgi:DNA-binding GntR family transcriptional regulator